MKHSKVGGLMTVPAITVHAEQSVADTSRLMVRRGMERLPVLDEEERLVGRVTRRDLLAVVDRLSAQGDDIRLSPAARTARGVFA
ncbi:CBS domain-containing protein [Streptomyces sp. LMG1-1-1.1]|uniref:CBS domain-containing protein n=1 Tax=Streptomyces sp. LMG1-1-1.1 TaxID=3135245 RepID=UPI0034B778B7